MGRNIGILFFAAIFNTSFNSSLGAATKPHVVLFGKPTTVSLRTEDDNSKAVTVKIRPLLVDGHSKEFTVGIAHDVTERTFVVQRIYKLNDSLPQESGPTRWRWQVGGWLLVDRAGGKVQQVALPDFDPDFSEVSWFRDYAAYYGTSDDGQKILALVVQLGHRKPLLKKVFAESKEVSFPGPAPSWERSPVRAIFASYSDHRLIFEVKSRAVEAITDDDEDNASE